MHKQNFSQAFQDLGITPEPLTDYYTPELYAKKLMERYNNRKAYKVIFSSSIEYQETKK